jgi:hypothetical protein
MWEKEMEDNEFYNEMHNMEVQWGSLSVRKHFSLLTIGEILTQFGFESLPHYFLA